LNAKLITRLVWIVAIVALLGIGVFIFKGASPVVVLPSEPVFNIGPWAVRNTVLTSWLVIIFLVVASFLATRKMDLVPVRFLQNFVEALIEWMYGIVEDAAGPANARRFFPLVATIFLYVICSNWFGLLPFYNTIGRVNPPEAAAGQTGTAIAYHIYHLGSLPIAIEPLHPQTVPVVANANGEAVNANGQPLATGNSGEADGVLVPYFRSVFSDANAPLSLALVSFVAVEYWGITALGLGSYLSKFFNFGALFHGKPLGLIDVFVGFLELLSELVRIISFTFRLLGNIFAGEVLIGFMTFIIPFLLPTLFYGLELFFGMIQAAIFALLTLVFGIMAVESHAEGEHEQHEPAGHKVEPEPA
jgi:F-type H+-transporting ATPase subunit a